MILPVDGILRTHSRFEGRKESPATEVALECGSVKLKLNSHLDKCTFCMLTQFDVKGGFILRLYTFHDICRGNKLNNL